VTEIAHLAGIIRNVRLQQNYGIMAFFRIYLWEYYWLCTLAGVDLILHSVCCLLWNAYILCYRLVAEVWNESNRKLYSWFVTGRVVTQWLPVYAVFRISRAETTSFLEKTLPNLFIKIGDTVSADIYTHTQTQTYNLQCEMNNVHSKAGSKPAYSAAWNQTANS